MKGIPFSGGPLTSEPAWMSTPGCSSTPAFFIAVEFRARRTANFKPHALETKLRKTLCIGNLKSRQDGVELKQLLSNTGKVLHFRMMVHQDMRHHDGFAIVEMEDECDAIAAARTLNSTAFQGTTLEVRVASAIEESGSGHPRIFGEMNMSDDPAAPTNAAKRKKPGDLP